MSKYVISCCTTVDTTREHLNSRDIKTICFHYELDGVDHPDDMGETMSFDEFYAAMAKGAMTKTSQVNTDEYCKYFEEFLKDGLDVLHITLSSGISGTYNAAAIAANMMQEKYPERKMFVIDSLSASAGGGLLIDKMADLRDEGMSIDDLRKWTEENKLRLNHWFFSTDLKYYVRGGRISKVEGFFGNALNICPLMNVDYEGRLIVRQKVRGKKKVINAIVEKMVELADGGTDYDGKCYMVQSACMDDARAVADLVEAKFPKLNGKVEIFNIGTTIGSHTGPGTVALFFWGKKRED